MRAEPPDHLTQRAWQMLADARTSAMTHDEATEQAILFLRRNLSYLARRERRGHHTSYDELLARDLEAVARLVVLLEQSSSATHATAESEAEVWIRTDPSRILVMLPRFRESVCFFPLKEAHGYPGALRVSSSCASRGSDRQRVTPARRVPGG